MFELGASEAEGDLGDGVGIGESDERFGEALQRGARWKVAGWL